MRCVRCEWLEKCRYLYLFLQTLVRAFAKGACKNKPLVEFKSLLIPINNACIDRTSHFTHINNSFSLQLNSHPGGLVG